MSSLLYFNAETGTDGTTLTAGNSGFTTVSGITRFSTAAAHSGNLGYRVTIAAGGAITYTNAQVSTGSVAASELARSYFKISAYPTAEQEIIFSNSNTGFGPISIRLQPNGTLKVYNQGPVLYTSTYVVPLNQWVRVEWVANQNGTASAPFGFGVTTGETPLTTTDSSINGYFWTTTANLTTAGGWAVNGFGETDPANWPVGTTIDYDDIYVIADVGVVSFTSDPATWIGPIPDTTVPTNPQVVAASQINAVTNAVGFSFPVGYTTPVAGDVQVTILATASGVTHGAAAAGWTTAITGNTPSSQERISVYYRVLTASDTGTGTLTTPSPISGNMSITRLIIRGADKGSPLDGASLSQGVFADGSSTTPTAPSFSAARNNALLITTFIQLQTSGATTGKLSLPSGMFPAATQGGNTASSYVSRVSSQKVDAGATGTRASTSNATGSWGAVSIVANAPIAVQFVTAATAVANGTTGTVSISVNPTALTALVLAGDRVTMHVASTPGGVQPNTPTGWTLVSSTTVGAGTQGSGTGPRQITVFYRDYDGVWTMPSVVLPTATNPAMSINWFATRLGYPVTRMFDEPNVLVASDTVSDTSWSVTRPSASLPESSMLSMATAVSNSTTVSALGISATGVTFQGPNNRPGANTSLGDVVGLLFATAPILTSAGAAAATFTQTLSVATQGGTAFILQADRGLSADYTSNPSDAAAGGDAVGVVQISARTAPEAAAIVDTASASIGQNATGADVAAIVDAVTIAFNAGVADVAAVIDATRKDVGSTYADVAAGTDAVALARATSASDIAGVVDSLSTLFVTQVVINDVAGATDLVISAPVLAPVFHDTAGAVDAVFISIARFISDLAAGTDAVTKSVNDTVSDTAAAVDAVQITRTSSRSVADVAAAVDLVTQIRATFRTSADTAAAIDAASIIRGFLRSDVVAAIDASLADKVTTLLASTSIDVDVTATLSPFEEVETTSEVIAVASDSSLHLVRLLYAVADITITVDGDLIFGEETAQVDIDMLHVPLTQVHAVSGTADVSVDLTADLSSAAQVAQVTVDTDESNLAHVRSLSAVASVELTTDQTVLRAVRLLSPIVEEEAMGMITIPKPAALVVPTYDRVFTVLRR
jgi:hypothetical protein